MTELDTIRLKLFKDKYLKMNPYKVVDCDMDCFCAYTYVDIKKMEEHYPELYKEMEELRKDFDYELSEIDDEYLYLIRR
jgi:hypothetical protein